MKRPVCEAERVMSEGQDIEVVLALRGLMR